MYSTKLEEYSIANLFIASFFKVVPKTNESVHFSVGRIYYTGHKFKTYQEVSMAAVEWRYRSQLCRYRPFVSTRNMNIYSVVKLTSLWSNFRAVKDFLCYLLHTKALSSRRRFRRKLIETYLVESKSRFSDGWFWHRLRSFSLFFLQFHGRFLATG